MKAIKLVTSIICILLCSTSSFAQNDISLNGKWTFTSPVHKGIEVTVPHTYNVMEGLEDYAGEASYSRNLPITEEMEGKQVRIRFNGVYHDATVMVNGHIAGIHKNAGYTAFSIDATPYLDFNEIENNTIEVRCSNSYSSTNMPWKRHFDWANDGGIYRSVSMHVSGEMSVRYLHVTPVINLIDSTAHAGICIRLHEDEIKRAVFNLKIKENESGRYIFDSDLKLRKEQDGTFKTTVDCGKVALWHFDDPNLYSYEICVYNGKEISDFKCENFGFRKVEIAGDKVLLNGEPVRLPGIEDMPGSHPYIGMAETHEDMREACQMMKDMGCTITRYHWAQDEYRMHLMDSLGILVQEEISWWQGPWDKLGDTLAHTVNRQIEEMIESHYNHPCIWAWGLSNEVGDNREDLVKMKSYASRFDTTRYYISMSNHIWSSLENDPPLALDMPTWNDYTGTWHGEHRDQLSGFFKIVEPVLNGRPLLITEAGLCEPVFTGGDSRRIDEMFFHLNEWVKHPYVWGYIYFCLTDYRTQMGEEGLGRHRIRRHGVCDKYRNPKPSYYVLQQLMCPVEITEVKPYGTSKVEGSLANQYDLESHSNDAQITISVKDGIPSYTIRGYKVAYADRNNEKQEINLPDLSPGESIQIILKDINSEYDFKVVRSNDSVVMDY